MYGHLGIKVLVAKLYNDVAKTRFTCCSLEEKIEGKLNGHGETNTKYRFCKQSVDFGQPYYEFVWFVYPIWHDYVTKTY